MLNDAKCEGSNEAMRDRKGDARPPGWNMHDAAHLNGEPGTVARTQRVLPNSGRSITIELASRFLGMDKHTLLLPVPKVLIITR